ncbi:transposase [Phaeobacter sp. B1627]|nr:transposase [Phaeobacter sp. B1627]
MGVTIEEDYGHKLRYLGPARVAIPSSQPSFPRCYGTEMPSNAILVPCSECRIEWNYIAPGKPVQNGFEERSNGRMPYKLLGGTMLRRRFQFAA